MVEESCDEIVRSRGELLDSVMELKNDEAVAR
jgi:hypothetical protein